MVEKSAVFAFSGTLFLAFMLLPMSTSAVQCGDGMCETGEGCISCQADCGLCDGEMCITDRDCASNICCNGVCEGFCIVYSESEGLGGTGLFLSNPVNIVIFLGVLIAIVAAAIIYAVFIRKKNIKPGPGYNDAPKPASS